MDMYLKVDATRLPENNGIGIGTGIYVRAKLHDMWGNYDIAYLDTESLDRWLRSRDSIELPINVVKVLLSHEQDD